MRPRHDTEAIPVITALDIATNIALVEAATTGGIDAGSPSTRTPESIANASEQSDQEDRRTRWQKLAAKGLDVLEVIGRSNPYGPMY